MKKKSTYIILAILVIGLFFYGYRIFSTGFNIDKTVYIYISMMTKIIIHCTKR